MNWNFVGDELSVEQIFDLYKEKLENDPQSLKLELERELEPLYTRMDNDQEGRGVVGDVLQGNTIASLEALRAECVKRIREQA